MEIIIHAQALVEIINTTPILVRGNIQYNGGNRRNDHYMATRCRCLRFDPLQGIGGPMTRLRTKTMKEGLQQLIVELKAKGEMKTQN